MQEVSIAEFAKLELIKLNRSVPLCPNDPVLDHARPFFSRMILVSPVRTFTRRSSGWASAAQGLKVFQVYAKC